MAITSCFAIVLVTSEFVSLLTGSLVTAAPVSRLGYQQRFGLTAQNQTAIVGDIVTLPCRVDYKTGVVQWTKDGFGLGIDEELEAFDRYSMPTSKSESDFRLVINPVSLEDEAFFQCQVSPAWEGDVQLRSSNIKLTVMVPTSPPEISNGALLQTTEGIEVQLECIAKGGKPAAEITWIDQHTRQIIQGAEVIKKQLEDKLTFSTKSILHFRPTKDHHQKTLTCQAQNIASKTVLSAHIQLSVQVKYASDVTVNTQVPTAAPKVKGEHLAIVLSGVFGMVVIVALIGIIIFRQRRTKQTNDLSNSK